MARNLAGKTYEVYTADGKRWIYDSTFDTRSAALQHAEELLAALAGGGVRVVAENERTGEEDVIFEERQDRDEKVIKLVAIDEAPPCKDIADYYRFPARRTAGRLLRRYLDEEGISAIEMLFRPGQLMMFERNDRLFPAAVQSIATIQAKATGKKAPERADEIYRVFARLKERAKKAADEEKYPALLEAKGINALVDGAGQWEKKKENAEFHIRAAIARHVGARGDWDGKVQLLINLVREAPNATAVKYADEITAEILDGAQAVKEVLGGQPDAASANRQLILLSGGRCPAPKNPISCIIELNEALARLDMPLTRSVLLERVQNEIGSIRELTKEGRDAERDAFAGLVRELFDLDGLMGGPGMAEAVVKRARMVLATGDTDLSVEQAIDHLLDMMPNRAVRLGFLLDLSASALGEAENRLVREALDRIAKQLSFLASLVPDTTGPDEVAGVVDGLKGRLMNERLPADWRAQMIATLDELVDRAAGGGGNADANGSTKEAGDGKGPKGMSDPTGERENVKAGGVIFTEGEVGEVAYLIVDGEVEIFRASGNAERILATLGRGEIIGEMSLIDNQPRVASARALQDTQVTKISRRSLQVRLDRLEETDRVLRRLIAVLVSRIRGQADSPE